MVLGFLLPCFEPENKNEHLNNIRRMSEMLTQDSRKIRDNILKILRVRHENIKNSSIIYRFYSETKELIDQYRDGRSHVEGKISSDYYIELLASGAVPKRI